MVLRPAFRQASPCFLVMHSLEHSSLDVNEALEKYGYDDVLSRKRVRRWEKQNLRGHPGFAAGICRGAPP